MMITSENDRDINVANWVRVGFYTTAIPFNFCLIAQILTVGVAYFTDWLGGLFMCCWCEGIVGCR